MNTKNLLIALLLALAVANTAGCAVQDRAKLFRTPGQAPHDPPQGRMLFEQIPNWDDAAYRRCGSHLRPKDMKPGMTRRC
jgi:hypothetical protein